VDCAQVAELLPWLLNGTLEGPEADAVRGHLQGCAVCGREWNETLRAAAVCGAHLPTAVLVDLAWDRRPEGLAPEGVRAHLDACASCREELALVQESRRLEAEPLPIASSPGVLYRRAVTYAGLAAGLVVAFLAGTRWPAGGPEEARTSSQAARERLATTQAEVEDLRAANAALRERVLRLEAPEASLPVFEVFSGKRRSGAAENELVLPAGTTRFALVLNVTAPPPRPVTAELRDEHGAVRWTAPALQAGPLGYTLGIPADLVPDGSASLTLLDQGRTIERYALRVRRPARPR
jgi:putative zinc finger protein